MKRKLSSRVMVTPLLILLFSRAVEGSRIASWYDTHFGAPQLVYLSPDSNIFYSLCNSSDLPVLPYDNSAKFNLKWVPDSSTSHLTGFGFQKDGVYYTAIFYEVFGDGASLVGEVFRCERDGYYSSEAVRSWNITDDVGMDGPVHGGLAALALPDAQGYRVYYQTADFHTMALRYTPSEGAWKDDGAVLQDRVQSGSLAAGCFDKDRITVVTMQVGGGGIEVMSLVGNTWAIDTLPIPIAPQGRTNNTIGYDSAHTGSAEDRNREGIEAFGNLGAQLSLIYDSSGGRSVLYIGPDRKLHAYKEDDGDWQLSKQEDRKYWPLSDYPEIDFGYAFDSARDQIWLYYFSNNTMIQAHQSGPGKWVEAVALPKSPPSPGPSEPGGGGAGGKRDVDEKDPGPDGGQGRYSPRSFGTQVGKGFGIGFSIGIPVAAVVAAYLLHRRYSLEQKAAKEHAASELLEAHDSVHEMQDTTARPHEMYGDGQIHELPGSDVRELSAE